MRLPSRSSAMAAAFIIALAAGCGDEGGGGVAWVGVWKVDASATGTADGKTWENAFTHPQDAVDAAAADPVNKEIWVAAGTYASLASGTTVLALAPDVQVYGGFLGVEDLRADRNPDAKTNGMYLDGDGLNRVVEGAPGARLDGFWVMDGLAYSGAGLYATECDGLVVANCTFNQNAADNPADSGSGGAVYADNSSVVLDGCDFSRNSAEGAGGAVVVSVDPFHEVDVIVTSCMFVSNTAGGNGAGLYAGLNYESTLLVDGCRFRSNDSSGDGGGLYLMAPGRASVVNSIFYDNSAHDGGGACNRPGGVDSVIGYAHCSFSLNDATDPGGYAGSGGGMYNGGFGNVAVMSSILYGNTAEIANLQQVSTTDPDVICIVSHSVVDQSTLGGGYVEGTGFVGPGTDPLFGAGPDLPLQAGSPCIDRCPWTWINGDGVRYDIDGNPRIIATNLVDIVGVGYEPADAPPQNGWLSDMGPHEIQP